MTKIDKDEIARLTEQYGGEWGINHTRRLLHLISVVGEGREYNTDAVWLAAHLHDWGGYAEWAQPGTNHALRSKDVAKTFLTQKGTQRIWWNWYWSALNTTTAVIPTGVLKPSS